MSTEFPDVRQATPSSCGVACLRAVYAWEGVTEPEGLDALADEDGFIGGVEGMVGAATGLGTPVRHEELRAPSIALIEDEDGIEHWVVVLSISGCSVDFHCPVDGRREVSLDEFKFLGACVTWR